MKRSGWTTLALAGLMLAPARAGQSQDPRSQRAGPPPPPGPEYVFTVNRGAGAGGNAVTVFDYTLAPPSIRTNISRVLPDPPFEFNGQDGIIEVRSRNVIVVSNRTGTFLTFIDGGSFAVLGTVTIPNASTLGGMCVAPDDSAIFVAGQTSAGATPSNSPAVFRVNLPTIPPGPGDVSIATAISDSGNAAQDCAVLRAGSVGGTGNGPGKIYYSVPTGAGGGYVFHHNLVTMASGSIQFQAAPIPNVQQPGALDSSPDDTVLFVGCANATTLVTYLVRVTTATDSPTEVTLFTDTGPGLFSSADVTFRPELGPGMKAYVLANSAVQRIHQVLADGTVDPNSVFPGGMTAVSIRHNPQPNDDRAYVGGINAQNTYGILDVSGGWPGGFTTHPSGANGPGQFAFSAKPPPPIVVEVCPKGGPNVAGTQITVRGLQFQAGATVELIDQAGLPTLLTPVSETPPNTIVAALPGPVSLEELDVRVRNPDNQTGELNQYLMPCAFPPATFGLTLPTRVQGYRMLSVPAYADVTALRQGLEAALGPYNRFFYRVFLMKPDGTYVELPQVMTAACDLAGSAFWAITRFGAQASVTGLDCYENRSTVPALGIRAVTVFPGWNMISMPYFNRAGNQFTMNWTVVQATTDGSDWLPQGPASLPAGPITGGLLYEYVNRQYATTTTMLAGRGYFVHNNTNAPLYLLFNDADVFKPAQGFEPSYDPVPAGAPLPPPPPGDVEDEPSESGGGCGLGGPELLFPALAGLVWRRRPGRRRLTV